MVIPSLTNNVHGLSSYITLKELKALKDNEFIDNKLYLKPTDSPAPRFYDNQKYPSQEFPHVLGLLSSGLHSALPTCMPTTRKVRAAFLADLEMGNLRISLAI